MGEKGDAEMENLFIPTLSFWENRNSWYGGVDPVRFYIQPKEDTLAVQLWLGPLSLALSEVVAEEVFPLSQEGIGQLTDWLEGQILLLRET